MTPLEDHAESAWSARHTPGYPDHKLTVTDGQGHVLALNLGAPNLDALAEACRLIARGPLPSGASTISVRVGRDVYVLSWHTNPAGVPDIEIAQLFQPGCWLHLAPDMVVLFASLIEERLARQCAS
jgi:hypothetical protein